LSSQTGHVYRLPSEAEWEYACRAGSQQQYCGGDNVADVAWFDSNSGATTHAVALKRPNALGLYDLSGNVWEWTQDCWNENYNGAPTNGSPWTQGDCSQRVVRGGSWTYFPQNLRSAFRGRYSTAYRGNFYGGGFRVARTD
jgi:formylglycine-generating enzyme required for sulfatase activity